MSGFSAAWLSSREAADARSSNRDVRAALRDAFAARSDVTVVDLGCGTGANLRVTAPFLGSRQNWTLVDNDPVLLDAARSALTAWAESATGTSDRILLRKDGRTIEVGFRQADLVHELDDALGDRPDLIVASAFFDLVSASFIDGFSAAACRLGVAVCATLNYNGSQSWSPSHPADESVRRAFNVHQVTDKGFGPAAGPRGVGRLAEALGASRYRVISGESPWCLGPEDAALLSDLLAGIAAAVSETDLVDRHELAEWQAVTRHGGVIGHTDLLAIPEQTTGP